MANASARMTIGALFGTVSSAAGAITQSIDTAVYGINMVEAWAKSASVDQAKRLVIHRQNYDANLLRETSIEMAERDQEVVEYVSKSASHKKLYEENYNRLAAALAAHEAG